MGKPPQAERAPQTPFPGPGVSGLGFGLDGARSPRTQ